MAQTTTDAAGAKVNFSGNSSGLKVNDSSGNELGIVRYVKDQSSWGPSVVLDVTNTSAASGIITFTFSTTWLFDLNWATPPEVLRRMPYDNTLKVGTFDASSGRTGTFGTPHNYNFHFNAPQKTTDATNYYSNVSMINARTTSFNFMDNRFTDRITSASAFQTLQNTGGASGVSSQGYAIRRNYFAWLDNQSIIPSTITVELGSYYVSAATGRIQAAVGSTYPAYNESAMTTRTIPYTNAGNNVSFANMQAQIAATGKSGAYYSLQDNGQYAIAVTLTYADTILTPAELESNTRKNPDPATATSNIEADVQATKNFYSKALGNSATYIFIVPSFQLTDQYKKSLITYTMCNIDDADWSKGTGYTSPVSIAAAGQTAVKSHYLGLDGSSVNPVTATAGDPTGKANSITGTKGTASAPASPADVAGYRPLTVADLSTLTAAQRQTIATTLGTTDSSVAGLTALANKTTGKTVWATNNLTVPYPGETGKTYNSAGDIVAAGTAGSTTGWGTTDVYYFYTLATQTLNIHAIAVPCYTNSADANSGKDCDAQPANGTSWQPSDGNEVTSLSETFTGLSGTTATNTLTKYSVQLGGKDHPVSLSAGLQQLAPGTDSKRTINFQLNTTFDMDNNLDQDEYVYVQANPEKDISKTTTRTIHYKLNHNTVDTPPADVTQTVTWTQHQIHNVAYDQIDGSPNWDKNAWRTADTGKGLVNMSEVNSPTIPGYIAKTPVVSKIVGLDNMGNGTGYDASGRYEVVYFDPTDPANRDTSDRTLTVNVVYNKTVQRMPFTGGTGVLLGSIIALALLAVAAVLVRLRNKQTNQ